MKERGEVSNPGAFGMNGRGRESYPRQLKSNQTRWKAEGKNSPQPKKKNSHWFWTVGDHTESQAGKVRKARTTRGEHKNDLPKPEFRMS